ncbi:MAG: CxxC-x17-CxxC domain-containing protein [Patescibacteria group bacterium]|jgi:CxxC-x17-CxxC domain-containing protein
MAYFERDSRGGGKGFGGKKSFGGPRFGGGDRGGFNKPRPFMHKATCATCGQECEVPFKPSGDRPVYCSNCFKRPEGDDRGGNRGNFQDRAIGNKPMFQKSAPSSGNNDQLKAQIEMLNTKLDKILQALVPATVKVESAENKTETKKAAPAKAKAAPKKVAKKKK